MWDVAGVVFALVLFTCCPRTCDSPRLRRNPCICQLVPTFPESVRAESGVGDDLETSRKLLSIFRPTAVIGPICGSIFFGFFFIAVCYIEHIHTHARTCAQIPRPRYQVENGRARPPRTSINSENRRTNKYTCPAFGVISAIRPIEQSTTIGSENISIPCIPFVIPSGDSDSSVPATPSTMWTALCLIATALVGTSYQRAPVSDPSSLLGRVGETIRLTRLTFIGSYRVPGYGHDQLGRRRRKSRRSQPVRVRRLRQLVAEHHRNHQQHRGARRERAADHTDRPELVRPVQ